MIDVKEAVRSALQFIGEMYSNDNLSDIRLEEVELDDAGTFWNVTIGFRAPGTAAAVSESLGSRYLRDYKVVKVDGANGIVRGMSILEVE